MHLSKLAQLAVIAVISSSAACASRQVAVTTPSTRDAVTLKVTNNATQSVTIVVSSGGTDYTVGTVGANSTAVLNVPQVAAGSTVRLRATLADGSNSYTRDGVVMSASTEWRVP